MKGANSIIASAIRPSSCSNGKLKNTPSAYFTPCIEYAAHPTYAAPLPRSDGGYLQIVLQCRVRPEGIDNKIEATVLTPEAMATPLHPNYDNAKMEWIAAEETMGKKNYVCYGLMFRITSEPPSSLPSSKWWLSCHGDFGKPPDFTSKGRRR